MDTNFINDDRFVDFDEPRTPVLSDPRDKIILNDRPALYRNYSPGLDGTGWYRMVDVTGGPSIILIR